jgi:chitinase
METMADYVDYTAEASQNQEFFMPKPADHFFKTNHNQQSSKYDAFFVVPKFDRDFNMQRHTYRIGSPYQQLVEIRPSSAEYSTGVEYDDFNSDNIDDDNIINKIKTQDFSRKNMLNVLCYMTNWAFYRKGDGQFVPENLDSKLCTHIIYSFASLEPETLTIKEFDPWADIDNG